METLNTPFRTAVFAAVALIPKGRVATYAQIAELAGNAHAARAVGGALHTNDDPRRVPCHRVVDAQGRPGSAYAFGGPAAQRQRLEAEGIVFRDDGTVDLQRYGIVIEQHPLQPFLPSAARLLFLGSFPPPRKKWSMEFFYPNYINDFWRIWGLLVYDDARHFESPGAKAFCRPRIEAFCRTAGMAFYDTASRVCRLRGNASDEYLHILQPAPLADFLQLLPRCEALVTTGGKSSEELLAILQSAPDFSLHAPSPSSSSPSVPAVGSVVTVTCWGRTLQWYRMPSSSRAYPMTLAAKATHYRTLLPLLDLEKQDDII